MKYYVKKSDVNNVKIIDSYNGDVNPDWFVEVDEPTQEVLSALNGQIMDVTPLVVENGVVVINTRKMAKINELKTLESELNQIDDVDASELLLELCEEVEKLSNGKPFAKFDKFKEKKNKQKQIQKIKDDLKGKEVKE